MTPRGIAGALFVLSLIACDSATPSDAGPDRDGGMDASVDARVPPGDARTDAGRDARTDAGYDAAVWLDGCVPSAERCDGVDDDCDGVIDEDPTDCMLPFAASACVGATCVVMSCDALRGDCDGAAANGCEVPLDTTIDCGGCGVPCAPADASASCVSGACAVASCDALFGDCNTDATDGCETRLETTVDCGACGTACMPAGATGTCAGGTCTILSCSVGFADCNGVDGDGCEADLTADATCGDCTTSCGAIPGGASSCVGGICQITCSAGSGDCDSDPATGCEAPLTSDSDCGACGNVCGATDECRSQRCVPRSWKRISLTSYSTCVLVSDEIWCWGSNFNGEVGDGTRTGLFPATERNHPTPARALVPNPVALGDGLAAISGDGEVYGWGAWHPGDGSPMTAFGVYPTPRRAVGVTDAVAVSQGSCLVHATGRVSCWAGQIPDGTSPTGRHVSVPTHVPGIYDAVGMGGDYVIRRSGHLLGGGLGADCMSLPAFCYAGTYRTLLEIDDARSVVVGSTSCAILSSGSVWCWTASGWGYGPPLFDPGVIPRRPYQMSGITDAVDLAIGNDHMCVLHRSGLVSCWGDNEYGQLGNGTRTDSAAPSLVPGLTNVREIDAGHSHTCAMRDDESVWCWGLNGHGELAIAISRDCRPRLDPWTCPSVTTPTRVLGIP